MCIDDEDDEEFYCEECGDIVDEGETLCEECQKTEYEE